MVFDQMNLPWLNYVLVNAPDPYFTGFSWFDIQGDHEEGIARNRQLLFQTIEKVCETEDIQPSPPFVFGFSQGCVMTIETVHALSTSPGRFDRCFGIRPSTESSLAEAQPHAKTHPFLLTHGSFDAVIPHSPVEKQVDRLAEAGIRCQWKVFPKEHTVMEKWNSTLSRISRRDSCRSSARGGADLEVEEMLTNLCGNLAYAGALAPFSLKWGPGSFGVGCFWSPQIVAQMAHGRVDEVSRKVLGIIVENHGSGCPQPDRAFRDDEAAFGGF